MEKYEYRGGRLVIARREMRLWLKVVTVVAFLSVVGAILAFCFLAAEAKADPAVQVSGQRATGAQAPISAASVTVYGTPATALVVTGPVTMAGPSSGGTSNMITVAVSPGDSAAANADATRGGIWFSNAGSTILYLRPNTGTATTVTDMPLLPAEKVLIDPPLGASLAWRVTSAGGLGDLRYIFIPKN